MTAMRSAARVDTSAVQRWWIADPAHPDQPPHEVAYPAAGTPNAEVTAWIVRLEQPRRGDMGASCAPLPCEGAGIATARSYRCSPRPAPRRRAGRRSQHG